MWSWLTTAVPRAVFRSLDWPRCRHVAKETSGTVKRATDRVLEHCQHSGQSDVRVAGHASDIRRPSEPTVPTVLHPCQILYPNKSVSPPRNLKRHSTRSGPKGGITCVLKNADKDLIRVRAQFRLLARGGSGLAVFAGTPDMPDARRLFGRFSAMLGQFGALFAGTARWGGAQFKCPAVSARLRLPDPPHPAKTRALIRVKMRCCQTDSQQDRDLPGQSEAR
jgi:hypothetical protein